MKTKTERGKNRSEMIRSAYGKVESKALFTDFMRITTDLKNIHIFCNVCGSILKTPYLDEVWSEYKKQLELEPSPCCKEKDNK